MVQRLVSSSPSDRLARALTALGRVLKTIHILRYISDESLRRRIQLQLNRGEHRHQLAKWLFFANRGEFRTRDYEEMMNKASCLSLLSNAVLVWNTVHLEKLVTQLRGSGEVILDEDLARISPLAHTHIIPNGTYNFSRAGGRAASPVPTRTPANSGRYFETGSSSRNRPSSSSIIAATAVTGLVIE